MTDKLLKLMVEISDNIDTLSEDKKEELYSHLEAVYNDKPLDPEIVKLLILGWHINDLYKNPPTKTE
jgi:hypothetical protein